jgi:hypothetical protein
MGNAFPCKYSRQQYLFFSVVWLVARETSCLVVFCDAVINHNEAAVKIQAEFLFETECGVTARCKSLIIIEARRLNVLGSFTDSRKSKLNQSAELSHLIYEAIFSDVWLWPN